MAPHPRRHPSRRHSGEWSSASSAKLGCAAERGGVRDEQVHRRAHRADNHLKMKGRSPTDFNAPRYSPTCTASSRICARQSAGSAARSWATRRADPAEPSLSDLPPATSSAPPGRRATRDLPHAPASSAEPGGGAAPARREAPSSIFAALCVRVSRAPSFTASSSPTFRHAVEVVAEAEAGRRRRRRRRQVLRWRCRRGGGDGE
jgi:hypothetical protein